MQTDPKIISLFKKKPIDKTPPIWLMRQAGRYLPEYRSVRQKAGDFLSLCYTPEMAEEVTLQPIQRFDFDAAILFADILLIPHALGQDLWFEEGEGPRLKPIMRADELDLQRAEERLAPIFETTKRLQKSLPDDKPLIGFAGAPWTVATYMIAGRGTADQKPAKSFMQENPCEFSAIIDRLVLATIDYLHGQVLSGARLLQIFESWGGALAGDSLRQWGEEPVAQIISGLRARGCTVPIIGFPRGIGYESLIPYAEYTGIDALGLDSSVDIARLVCDLPEHLVIQGNLDPEILLRGGDALDRAIDVILEATKNHRHIFNLGHGILPTTPLSHVARLVARVRGA